MFQRQEQSSYSVSVSYVEIYNEQVLDLLADLKDFGQLREEYKDLKIKDYINQIQKDGEKIQNVVDQSKAFSNHNRNRSLT